MKKTTFLISLILMVTMVFGQYHGADPQDLQKLQAEREMQKQMEEQNVPSFSLNPIKSQTKVQSQTKPYSWFNTKGNNLKNQWIHWDDGVNYDAIGTGAAADFHVAARFLPSDIADYSGYAITKVQFFPAQAAATYTIKVWQGTNPPVEVYSQLVASPTISQMNIVDLTTPVEFDASQELWVGYNVNATTGYPAGCDAGPQVAGKGNMIYWSGVWQELTALNPDLTFNWNIQAYVEMLADPAAPAAPTLLLVEPADLGVVSAEVSWTNPSLMVNGEELTELLTIELYVSGEEDPIYEDETPVIGEEDSYTFVGTEAGFYTFTVLGTNTAGNGLPASATVWLGADVPAAVSNIVLIAQGNDGLLTWDAPDGGAHGGYYSPGDLVEYKIRRNPDNVEFIVPVVKGMFLDETIPGIGYYSYTITPVSTVGEGSAATSATVLLAAEGAIFMGNGEVTICEGTFFDSGGPDSDYQNNENLTLTFHPETAGAKIRFNFTMFNTEAGYDYLYVYDGPNTSSPLVGQFHGTAVPPELVDITSTHESGSMTFRFTSDGSVTRPGWQATVSCFVPMDKDLRALSIAGNTTPSVGIESIYTIKISNVGAENVLGTQFTVEIRNASDDSVLGVANGNNINSGEVVDVLVPWIPDTDGPMLIYAYVNFPEDENFNDNETGEFNVVVQPEGVVVVTIGAGTKLLYMPFNFLWHHSLSQTLYFPEEIGMTGGVITGLQYKSTFNAPYLDRNIKIWIGETELTSLVDGWVDPASLQLVFDGTVDFPEGISDIFIPLDDIYIYGGGNLVIYSSKADVEWSGSKQFFGTETPNSNRSRRAQQDNTPYDPTNPPAGAANHDFPNIQIFFSTAGLGSLEGVVTDGTDPIEGVQVSILGTMAKAFTNADGEYSFPYVLPGTYDIEFTKFGYYDLVEEDVEILEDETTTIDVEINAIPQYTVVGVVKANDDTFIDGAVITLEGYDNYNAVSNEDGEFTIDYVYDGTYVLTVAYDGYITHIDEEVEINELVAVGGEVDLGIIELVEIIVAPYNLEVAIGEVAGEALFTWNNIWGLESFADSFEDQTYDAWDDYVQGPGVPGEGTSAYWHIISDASAPDGNYLSFVDWGYTIDTWLVTPDIAVTEGMTLSFWWNTSYYWSVSPNNNSDLHIKISTDGGNTWTSIWTEDDFGTFNNFVWYQTTLDLSAYAGVAKIAFNLVQDDGATVSLDHINISTAKRSIGTFARSIAPNVDEKAKSSKGEITMLAPTKAFVGYNVYLDEVLLTTEPTEETEYLFTGLIPGTSYTAGVQSVYTSNVSEIVELEFYVPAVNNVNFTVSNAVTEDILEGAEVVVYLDGIEVETLVTDEEGFATLELYEGSYTYTASFDGYLAVSGSFEILAVGDTDVSVELEPYFTITFSVVDEDAEPILDAVVTFAGVASPDGTYVFERIRGTYSYSISKTGYVTATGSVTVVDDDVEVDVVLDWVRYNVTFNVKNTASNPIEGATINIEDHDPATTNASGTAVMQMLNGNYSFTVSHEEYVGHTGEFTVAGAPVTQNITLVGVSAETLGWNNVKLFPNPFSEYITISNPEMVKRVVITNLIGQVVKDIVFNGEETIETANLQGGVYLLTIEGINGEKTVRKMIKK